MTVQGSGLWSQINGLKKIVCEPRGTGDLFDKAMSDYYSAIRRGKGGIFMAICRGKVSRTFAWLKQMQIDNQLL